MAKNYTVQQFLEVIKKSGGVISAIASALECDWHTADDYIKAHPTLVRALRDQKHHVTDKARYNVAKAIADGDLAISKWWLSVMDEEFIAKQRMELVGSIVVEWDDSENND